MLKFILYRFEIIKHPLIVLFSINIVLVFQADVTDDVDTLQLTGKKKKKKGPLPDGKQVTFRETDQAIAGKINVTSFTLHPLLFGIHL